MSICKTFDIVVVPFPFVDVIKTKNRPALVISSARHYNHVLGQTVLAMITSSLHDPWDLDIPIKNLKSCGLQKPSIIRLKLFTLDNRLIKGKIGRLSEQDQILVQEKVTLTLEDLLITQ